MLKELSVWIVARVNAVTGPPDLVIGTNVQYGFRAQDAPVRCHTFMESGGGISPDAFEIRDRVDYLMQIATRAATYETARVDAWAIYDAIDRTFGWQIAAVAPSTQKYEAQTIEALAAPQYIGIETVGSFSFSTNYMFRMIKR